MKTITVYILFSIILYFFLILILKRVIQNHINKNIFVKIEKILIIAGYFFIPIFIIFAYSILCV